MKTVGKSTWKQCRARRIEKLFRRTGTNLWILCRKMRKQLHNIEAFSMVLGRLSLECSSS